jgi:predicted glycogen debranching enzyme
MAEHTFRATGRGHLPLAVDFGRGICDDLRASERREWLVTNGIGGFASGTIAGHLTRRYHGLLFAALKPPLGRTLLLTKLEETVECDQQKYQLFTNQWSRDHIEPCGFVHIERFHLDGTTPVWTFSVGDALIIKRVWMPHGENTTFVRYDVIRASGPLRLEIKAFVNYRDYHSLTQGEGWTFGIDPVESGLRIHAYEGATPLFLLSRECRFHGTGVWFKNFFLAAENDRGLPHSEDHLHAGTFSVTLEPGGSCSIAATVDASALHSVDTSLSQKSSRESDLIATFARSNTLDSSDVHPWISQYVLAADQFIVDRKLPSQPDGKSIIAGYHWFGDWGRDTMISLSGIALSTGRYETAQTILRTYAEFVDKGMLPNRFPDSSEVPEYNTVDASLWYFAAVHAYYEATGDKGLVAELYPVLSDIVGWHVRGTRYDIHVDSEDGLLYAGQAGMQLTWMDAKIGEWVVTPRIGKPVEVNALWYNALCILTYFAEVLDKDSREYKRFATKTKNGFGRFWRGDVGYCWDVLDGPDGADGSLRPNQILAASLPSSALTLDQKRKVVEACGRHLLTPFGLRSLSRADARYQAHYVGDMRSRDSAYHQGTVWGWLLGPFVTAHLLIHHDPEVAMSYLQPMMFHLLDHGIGTASEVFDGDPPFTPRGCMAQAWTVAEVLRVWPTILRNSNDMERK